MSNNTSIKNTLKNRISKMHKLSLTNWNPVVSEIHFIEVRRLTSYQRAFIPLLITRIINISQQVNTIQILSTKRETTVQMSLKGRTRFNPLNPAATCVTRQLTARKIISHGLKEFFLRYNQLTKISLKLRFRDSYIHACESQMHCRQAVLSSTSLQTRLP